MLIEHGVEVWTRYRQVSILYWRCKPTDVPVISGNQIRFQFSIGDAEEEGITDGRRWLCFNSLLEMPGLVEF